MLDLGARGGVRDLLDLKPLTRVFGFEPNAAECAPLEADWHTAGWLGARFAPTAVGRSVGTGRFRLNRVAGSSSFLTPNERVLRPFGTFAREFEQVGEELVPMTTLDAFAADQDLEYLDYVKIDVQGSELDVIAGAGDVLSRGGFVVRSEVCFRPLYEGQPLFRDIDLALSGLGFTLLMLDNVHYPSSVKSRDLAGPRMGIGDPGELLWCDAVYVKDVVANPDLLPEDPARSLAHLLVLESLGFVGYALDLADLLADRDADEASLAAALGRAIRRRHRLSVLDRPFASAVLRGRLTRGLLGREPYSGRHVR
jgi:FkbM family methyltransferase